MPRRVAPFRRTFDSATDAAQRFHAENLGFLQPILDRGEPREAVREWLRSNAHGRTGRMKVKDLSQTPWAAKMLASPDPVMGALRNVFGHAKGRRWDRVDWGAIRSLGETLAEFGGESEGAGPGGWTWYPIAIEDDDAKILDRLSTEGEPDAYRRFAASLSEREIESAISTYESEVRRLARCMSPQRRRHIDARLAEIRTWKTSGIPESVCGQAVYAGHTCDLEPLHGELMRLRDACKSDAAYAAWRNEALRRVARAGSVAQAEADEVPVELLPVEAFEGDAPVPACTPSEAARIMGRLGAAKRRENAAKRRKVREANAAARRSERARVSKARKREKQGSAAPKQTPTSVKSTERVPTLDVKAVNRGLRPSGWQVLDLAVNKTTGFVRLVVEQRDPAAGKGRMVTLVRSGHGGKTVMVRDITALKSGAYQSEWTVVAPMGQSRHEDVVSALRDLATYIADNATGFSLRRAKSVLLPLASAVATVSAREEPASSSASRGKQTPRRGPSTASGVVPGKTLAAGLRFFGRDANSKDRRLKHEDGVAVLEGKPAPSWAVYVFAYPKERKFANVRGSGGENRIVVFGPLGLASHLAEALRRLRVARDAEELAEDGLSMLATLAEFQARLPKAPKPATSKGPDSKPQAPSRVPQMPTRGQGSLLTAEEEGFALTHPRGTAAVHGSSAGTGGTQSVMPGVIRKVSAKKMAEMKERERVRRIAGRSGGTSRRGPSPAANSDVSRMTTTALQALVFRLEGELGVSNWPRARAEAHYESIGMATAELYTRGVLEPVLSGTGGPNERPLTSVGADDVDNAFRGDPPGVAVPRWLATNLAYVLSPQFEGGQLTLVRGPQSMASGRAESLYVVRKGGLLGYEGRRARITVRRNGGDYVVEIEGMPQSVARLVESAVRKVMGDTVLRMQAQDSSGLTWRRG